MIDNGYVNKHMFTEYFPDQPINVDREFFWCIFFQVSPDRAENYVQKVLTQHQEELAKPPPKKNYADIGDDFLDKLLLYHQRPRE